MMPTIDGLDIHPDYQPVTDWDAIPQYLVMSVKCTEGATAEKAGARTYWAQFRRRNFRYRGLYHWLRPDSTAAAQFANLKRFVDSVGGLRVGEFVQVDWERTLDAKGKPLPMPTLALLLEFNRLCQREWPGKVLVYVSDWVTNFHQWLATNPVEPLWYANYNTDPKNYAGGWQECARYGAVVWQCTSTFTAPGINSPGHTDANHIFDIGAMDRLAGYAVDPPVVKPLPVPAVVVPWGPEEDVEMNAKLVQSDDGQVALQLFVADGYTFHGLAGQSIASVKAGYDTGDAINVDAAVFADMAAKAKQKNV